MVTTPFRAPRRAAAATALLALAADAAAAQTIPKGARTIELETVASGLVSPDGVTHAGDGSGRLFIVEQSGQIRIVDDGVLLPAPFLDIADRLPVLDGFFDERGLLGLAFHPDYETNGRFFVRYSAPRAGVEGEPCFGTTRGCHEEILAEFHVSAGDPNVADAASGQILFRIDEPQFNHDGGEVAFGPDGYLYFSLGDGGGAHDGLVDDPPSHGPIGNGQNKDTALGSMLRIDVDGGFPYMIPPDNPFVGADGLDEIYAYGLRNPFKFSFDDGPGGDGSLYVADVGQNRFEEVSRVVSGGNYGWVLKEGFHCFDPFDPTNPPDVCTDVGADGAPLLPPLVEYDHTDGISVIGGFVYRGSRSPALFGHYVFGDFATAFFEPSGRLFYVVDMSAPAPEIFEFQIGAEDRPYGLFLKGLGEGEDGEVYVCGSTALEPYGTGGVVQRVVAADTSFCIGAPNSVGDGGRILAGGTISVGRSDFELLASGCPPREFGVFFFGFASFQAPFGDGFLCVGPFAPGLFRLFPAVRTDGAGRASATVDFTALPIVAGSTSFFQYWYRDPRGPGGSGFNLTDGLEETFTP
jgi:glucose/arabinose dehydrogenase